MERPAIQHALSVRQLLPPDPWLPLLSSMAFWLLASLLVGLLANRWPQRWLQQPANPGHGEPPGIRVWKRWIPDFGGVLPGGVRKANLVQRDPASLRRLLQETRRAELVHWLLLPCGLFTALWLPPAGVAVNVVFGVVFNLPCLLLQRFNSGRLRRCLGRCS